MKDAKTDPFPVSEGTDSLVETANDREVSKNAGQGMIQQQNACPGAQMPSLQCPVQQNKVNKQR